MKGIGMILLATSVAMAMLIMMRLPVQLNKEEIKLLAQNYYEIQENEPLKGKIAIVTGSTSGLGEAIASQLYELGATVIIASRSQKKCDDTIQFIKSQIPSSSGQLISHTIDVADLKSVADFAAWFNQKFKSLNFLVNNAGINYRSSKMKPTAENPLVSPQGYDLTFASNYLGHFLLTELLLPRLMETRRSRVVHVSSGANYLVTGEDLMPNPNPIAALVPDHLDTAHWEDAYPNSKLAQILHMQALQRRVDEQTTDPSRLKILSSSPGFTLTPMVPPFLVTILGRLMYTPEAASYSTLRALFDDSLHGGSFIANTPNFWYSNSFGISIRKMIGDLGFKKLLFAIALPVNLILQNVFYGDHVTDPPNPVAQHNPELIDSFHRWSQAQIKKFFEN